MGRRKRERERDIKLSGMCLLISHVWKGEVAHINRSNIKGTEARYCLKRKATSTEWSGSRVSPNLPMGDMGELWDPRRQSW